MNKTPKLTHLPPVFRWSYFGPRYWPTWLMLGVLHITARLSIRTNIVLGRGLGWLLYYAAASRKHITETNIRLCFPELNYAERETMVRGVIQSCAIGFLESAIALWGPVRHIRHSINGLEHLQAAQAQGQGVLLVACHMTTLDIGGRLLAQYKKFNSLYRQDPNPLLAYMIVKGRERSIDESIISVETRKLVRKLRAGNIVWYAPDQDHGIKHSIFAPFFGISAATVPGPARFAKLGNAQIIFFAQYRNEDGSYTLELSPPMENISDDDFVNCTRVNQMLEQIIRKQPDQYMWVHRRFKTRPEGEPNVYTKKK